MNFPAILRGRVERVFSYGFVYMMTEDGWLQGDLGGRQPLLKHRKALIMTPTFFRASDYRESGCGAAIEQLVDDFGFRSPGIDQVEHAYFSAVGAVDDATRQAFPAGGARRRPSTRARAQARTPQGGGGGGSRAATGCRADRGGVRSRGGPAAAAAAIEELVTTALHVPALAASRRPCDHSTSADEGTARLTDRRTSIYL